MDDNLNIVLNFSEDTELQGVSNANYLFHEASENHLLNKVISRFPRGARVNEFVDTNVVNYRPLEAGWENGLLQEINNIILLFDNPDLPPLTDVSSGTTSNGTDAMFALRGEMYYLFSDHFDEQISESVREFLQEFFFGIGFNYWCGWAVLFQYTNLDVGMPIALRAQRNGVKFSIDQSTLIIEYHNS